jgi:hypothetical protein
VLTGGIIMSQPQYQKLRLASSTDLTAEVFNFYQLLSVFLSLYSKAGEREDVEEYKTAWTEAIHSLLLQVGSAFRMLELAQKSAREQMPLPENSSLVARVARLAERVSLCEENLTMWIPTARWGRVLLLIEEKLEMIGNQIAEYNPYVAGDMKKLLADGAKRREHITKMADSVTREAKSLQAAFALPVAM